MATMWTLMQGYLLIGLGLLFVASFGPAYGQYLRNCGKAEMISSFAAVIFAWPVVIYFAARGDE